MWRDVSALGDLQWRVLEKHDWFWRDIFERRNTVFNFTNLTAARQWIEEGAAIHLRRRTRRPTQDCARIV